MLEKFKKGQEACLIKTNFGTNKEPEVVPVIIMKVGKKYVTDDHDRRYKESNQYDYMCFERDRTYILFPDKKTAEEYLEKYQTERRLRKMNIDLRNYSMKQLKVLEEILKHPSLCEPEAIQNISSDKADASLYKLIKENDFYAGICEDVINTWNEAETEHERKSVESMFLIFTGMEFSDFIKGETA